MGVQTELKQVFDEKSSIKRRILKAADRLLGQLGSQQIVELLVNSGYEAKDKLRC